MASNEQLGKVLEVDEGSPVKIENIPEAREFEGSIFPITFVPSTERVTLDMLLEWLKEHGQNGSKKGTDESLENMMMKHGAILLRGFPIKSPQDFAECVKSIGYENFPYEGGVAVRRSVVGNIVYTANESPGHLKIPFHHEMTYAPNPPHKIFFYCDNPPDTDGQTPILHSHNLYNKITEHYPEFVEKLEKCGFIWHTRKTPHDRSDSIAGRGWKSSYSVTTKEELEEKLREKKLTWRWEENDVLVEKTAPRQAIKIDERTGKKQFFNHILGLTIVKDEYNPPEKILSFGDDTPFDDLKIIHKIIAITQEEKVQFSWQQGDILLIDNITTMHSRENFTGDRRILASLTK